MAKKNSLAGLWGGNLLIVRNLNSLVLIKRYDGMKIGVLSSTLQYVNTSIITLCVGSHCSKDFFYYIAVFEILSIYNQEQRCNLYNLNLQNCII